MWLNCMFKLKLNNRNAIAMGKIQISKLPLHAACATWDLSNENNLCYSMGNYDVLFDTSAYCGTATSLITMLMQHMIPPVRLDTQTI